MAFVELSSNLIFLHLLWLLLRFSDCEFVLLARTHSECFQINLSPVFLSEVFITGFEKVPILGMSAVKMRVRSRFDFTQDHLPEALTCHALLDLPVYQNKETLRAKVTEAINHKRGFWEE